MGNTPPPAVARSGAEVRRINLTDVDAALHVPGKRGMSEPHNLAEHVLLMQLKQARRARRLIDKRITRETRADKLWCPDAELVDSISKLTQATRAGFAEWRALRKFGQDSRQGLTDEQLDRVFDFHLQRRATSMEASKAWRFAAARWGENVADMLEPEGRKKS